MRFAISMAEQALEPLAGAAEHDVLLAGQQNLLDPGQTFDLERLRQLFQVFNQKRELLRLLDECVQGAGVQVYIGGESGYRFVDECSLVGSQYEVDGRVCGMLGVIGPSRMAYQSVIPMVDLTAKLLGAALNQRGSSPS
jgi:heat-inducible transcriptional repressor